MIDKPTDRQTNLTNKVFIESFQGVETLAFPILSLNNNQSTPLDCLIFQRGDDAVTRSCPCREKNE